MKSYEAMFILNPDLTENERKDLFTKIKDIVVKNNGKVLSGDIWSEKRKLYFPIKKYREGIYFLLNFSLDSKVVASLNHEYKLNDNILRFLITQAGLVR